MPGAGLLQAVFILAGVLPITGASQRKEQSSNHEREH